MSAIPLAVYERLVPRDVIGFCYHMVTDAHPAHTIHLGPHKTPVQFEADLRWLKSRYELIGYEELCERRQLSVASGQLSVAPLSRTSHLAPRTSRRRPAAILTFDDGLREHLTVVAPLLKKHEIPAIFFITAGFLDNRRLFYRHKVSLCLEAAQQRSEADVALIRDELTADSQARSTKHQAPSTKHQAPSTKHQAPSSPHPALRSLLLSLPIEAEPLIDHACNLLGVDTAAFLAEHRPYLTTAEVQHLAAAGFTLGAHSVTHARLTDNNTAPPLAPRTSHLAPEIVSSCQAISELTRTASVPFAFPFSGDGVSRESLRALRNDHPVIGLLFDRRGLRPDEPFIVHRLVADTPPKQPHTNLPTALRRAYHAVRKEPSSEPSATSRIRKPEFSL